VGAERHAARSGARPPMRAQLSGPHGRWTRLACGDKSRRRIPHVRERPCANMHMARVPMCMGSALGLCSRSGRPQIRPHCIGRMHGKKRDGSRANHSLYFIARRAARGASHLPVPGTPLHEMAEASAITGGPRAGCEEAPSASSSSAHRCLLRPPCPSSIGLSSDSRRRFRDSTALPPAEREGPGS